MKEFLLYVILSAGQTGVVHIANNKAMFYVDSVGYVTMTIVKREFEATQLDGIVRGDYILKQGELNGVLQVRQDEVHISIFTPGYSRSVTYKRRQILFKLNPCPTKRLFYSVKLDLAATNAALKDFATTASAAAKAGSDLKGQTELASQANDRAAAAAKKTQDALDMEANSIKDLRAQNIALTKVRNDTTTATEEGRLKILDLNKQLDANNAVIKKNVDSYTAQKINIGNYSGALDKLIPGLGATSEGIASMTKQALIFIATPVGVIITAIVAALALLSTYFTRTTEGSGQLNQALAAMNATFSVLLDRAAQLGGAMVKLFSGDFSGAAKDAAAAIQGVGTEIYNESVAAAEATASLKLLTDQERLHAIAASETTNAIKDLIIQSKSRMLTEQQRETLLDKASQLETQRSETERADMLARIALAAQLAERDNSQLGLQIQGDESYLDYAKRIVAIDGLKTASKEQLKQAIVDYNTAEGTSLDLQEKIATRKDNLEVAAQAKAQQTADKLAKLRDDEAKADQKWADEEAAIQNEYDKEETDTLQKTQDDAYNILKTAHDNELKLANDVAEGKAKIAAAEVKQQQTDANNFQKMLNDLKKAVGAATQVIMQGINTVAQAKQTEYNNEIIRIDNQAQAAQDALDNQLAQGLISQADYDKQKAAAAATVKAQEDAIKKKAFESQKKNQIASTIISGLKGAVDAIVMGVSEFGPVAGAIIGGIEAAAIAIFTAVQVSSINSQQFSARQGGQVPRKFADRSPIKRYSGGGKAFTLGGNSHENGGTKFFGEDGTRFEAEKGEGLFILKRDAHANFIREQSARNMQFGGRSWDGNKYALGGEVLAGFSTNNPQNLSNNLLQRIANAVNNQKLVMPVESITLLQNQQAQIKSNATVLQ